LITSQTRPNIIGDGVFPISVGGLQIAHGFVYEPALVSALARSNNFFPSAIYNMTFKKINPKESAANMLKKAVADNLCNLSTADLPTTRSVNMSAATSNTMKNSFTFYLDSNRRLRCTSSVHTKPVWDASSCTYKYNKVAISPSACKKAFQKASVGGRASLQSNIVKPSLPPLIAAMTPEIDKELQMADLPFESHVMAEFASSKLSIEAVIDPSLIIDYTPATLPSAEVQTAATFKKLVDLAPASQVVIPEYIKTAYDAIKVKPEVIGYAAPISETPIATSLINDSKQTFLQPIKNIYPDLMFAPSGCSQVHGFIFSKVDLSVAQ
jgi:hypothetical protein